ncbi:Hypothetical protein GLP15_5160 [Giardia lamblia P15]|uniref:Uncharacterized protein n=1 Tax=Giardia intestinalis (strain P15) TaxID=658858 RepID=E1EW92_GIAIA|nr:Hypothetical protein GLP15_5160 [Giardia lamblia P15]
MSHAAVVRASNLPPCKDKTSSPLTQLSLPTNSTQNSSSFTKSIKTPRPQNVLSSVPVSKNPDINQGLGNPGHSSCPSELTAQDYQGLEDLFTEVDNSRKLDASGIIFRWKEINLRVGDPDCNLLLFYLFQSCAVIHPNIIRHKDMAYFSDGSQEGRLHLLMEQPTGPSLSQLQEYYTVHPEHFSAQIFWDCSAQLILAADVLNKYKDGTFSSCMWCPPRLTAESIYFDSDGCIRLPQYYPLQDSSTKTGPVNRLKENTSETIVSLITEFASVITHVPGVDKNIVQIDKNEIKYLKSFVRKLTAYKTRPYITLHSLKCKHLSEAATLRQQGRQPNYPFPLKMSVSCNTSITDKHTYSHDPCTIPLSSAPSDELLTFSQDSQDSSLQSISKMSESPIDNRVSNEDTISKAVLSARTFSLFRKQHSTLESTPIPYTLETSNTLDTVIDIPMSTRLLYEGICRGLSLVKAAASKPSKTSGAGKKSKNNTFKDGDSKHLLADRELVLFSDFAQETAEKPPIVSHGHALPKTRSAISHMISRRKRFRTLLSYKCIEEINLYYGGNDLQIPRVTKEEVCPSMLYLDAITSANNYDDIDKCINADKVFTLLLSFDALNQLTEIEPRVISFLKRDSIIIKLVECYFLGEIADESPPFTHRQRRDIYLLFSKVFTHISSNPDLLEAILQHQFFKKTLFEMILSADYWLKFTTIKGKEGLSLKDALINKVRKEALEKFLQEIFSRADAIHFVRTALCGRYGEIMNALMQLQFASPYIRSSICMRLFDSSLVESAFNTLLGFIQDILTANDRRSIGKIICISNHLVTCLHTDPIKFKPLTEKMSKLKANLTDLLFAYDSELIALSAYILELVTSYYSISLCMSVQAHILTSTDIAASTVTEVMSSISEFANTIANIYMTKSLEEPSSNALRVQLVLILILRFMLSIGDAARTAFACVKTSTYLSGQDSYSQQSLQFQSLDCSELRRSVMGTSVYTGLELPVEWSGESYVSLRNKLKGILKEAGDIISTPVVSFMECVMDDEKFRDATTVHFLVTRFWIAVADTSYYFGVRPQTTILCVSKRIQSCMDGSEASARKYSNFTFLTVIPQKIIMMAMSSEPSLTNRWSSSYYSSNSVVLFSLNASHWAWIERNNEKIESAARLFGLSAKEVLDFLRINMINGR